MIQRRTILEAGVKDRQVFEYRVEIPIEDSGGKTTMGGVVIAETAADAKCKVLLWARHNYPDVVKQGEVELRTISFLVG